MGQENRVETVDRLPFALGALGSAFTWCWLFTSFNGNAFLFPFPEEMNFYRFLELLGIALGLVLIKSTSRRAGLTRSSRWFSLLPVLLSLPCMANLILAAFGAEAPRAFSLVAWVLLGASVSFCFTIWGSYFSAQKMEGSATYCILSTIIGAVLFFVISFEATFLSVITSFILLVASVVLSLTLTSAPAPSTSEVPYSRESAKAHVPLRLKLNVLAFGTAFGVGLFIVFNETKAEFMPILTVSFVPLGCGLLLYYLGIKKGRFSFQSVQRLLLPCMIAALLPMPFVDSVGKFFLGILLMSVSIFFDLTNCVNGIKTVERNNLAPQYFIAAGRLPYQIGEWLGWSLGFLLTLLWGSAGDGSELIALCLVLALCLVAVVNYLPIESPAEAVPAGNDEASTLEMRCDHIAKRRSLTPREREILPYLAKGRNAEYIQNRLGISMHTARAHIYHIYDKMAVHSQQDLLDVVDAEALDENDC